jgi:hypothetical protein
MRQNEIEWSEWDEYTELGSRWMDCIGRWKSDRAYREIASQRHGRVRALHGESSTGLAFSDEGRSKHAGR